MKKTYAIISDIHGNLQALLAVMKDIKTREIETIINLGDHFYGPMEPEGVAEIIRENPMICISGNTDRAILESLERDGMKSHKPEMERVKGELQARSIEWLKTLPNTTTIDDVFFACHGTPESDNEYLLELVNDKGVFVYNDDDLIEKTKSIKERIILCGHSHVNRLVYLTNNKIILNPGSVGLPAYLGSEKYQYRFAMESMTPHAKYAIVKVDGEHVNIEQINVAYDWNRASSVARSNGNNNWAQFLLTGRMPKDLRVD
ncbi:metallophosphoesterase family protein [Mucilaginibacter sp. KACC 22063]|uniref:metallophosphoesterase family protein n=1 Tax=Mucilaginibacter sp. KACC 22063 TaxID=3025666 RepID=UPI002365BEC4|nr:metallophosphoesterase family protein [Mucilaginibacter sp. KACC 22063]WDF56301.1 metallophosphoesterase family protein [Mucilaginibacter sp. KACC 22063]